MAVVLHEDKHVSDGGFPAVRHQQNFPPKITALGVKGRKHGDVTGPGGDVSRAQTPQLVEQRNRVGSGTEQLAVRTEKNLVGCLALGIRFRRKGLRRRGDSGQKTSQRLGDGEFARRFFPFGFLVQNGADDIARFEAAIDEV